MNNQLKAVEEFHTTFGHPVGNKPMIIPMKRYDLRFSLMAEENEEYLEAARTGNKVEIADALGDMMYILSGTILEHGMQGIIEDVFNEIQSSNMSKLGKDGKPILREDGKILKGPGYFKPNIAQFITGQYQMVQARDNKQWLFAMQDQLVPIVMEDDRGTPYGKTHFKEEVEQITTLKWETIRSNLKLIADLGDTLWYSFLDDLFIKNEIGIWSIYKVVKDE